MNKKVFWDNNKHNMLSSTLLTVVLCLVCLKINSQDVYLEYDHLPDLPPSIGQNVQPGLAGPYTGIDDNVLIVAGGANFPDKLPWEGGIKIYHDAIFILKEKTDGTFQWETTTAQLPFAAGYGEQYLQIMGSYALAGTQRTKIYRIAGL
ncbi:MAG: hypothetical protein R2814_00885 [Flavobacteriaceae bacterium]